MDKKETKPAKNEIKETAGKTSAPALRCPTAQCPVGQFLSLVCPACNIAFPFDPLKPKIDFSSKPIIWILGGPGSGKGTQCEKIIAKYGFAHFSTGDLLRVEVKSGSQQGKQLASIMAKGGLVPNEVVLALLKDAMEISAERANGFLIDGYPRERSQGIAFEEAIAPVTMVTYFEASLETLTKRLLGRAVTSGRTDDNEETIKLRLKTFLDNNDLVLAQYPDKLKRINAERTVDNIFAEVQMYLDPLMDRILTKKRMY